MDYNLITNLIDETLKKEITNELLINLYYRIGGILSDKNCNINELEVNLQAKYGIVIGFTKRNLKNMLNFYNTYNEKMLNKLKKIPWKNHLVILKNDDKEKLIDLCIKNNLDKESLLNYIKTKQISNVNEDSDEMLEEFTHLKNKINLI